MIPQIEVRRIRLDGAPRIGDRAVDDREIALQHLDRLGIEPAALLRHTPSPATGASAAAAAADCGRVIVNLRSSQSRRPRRVAARFAVTGASIELARRSRIRAAIPGQRSMGGGAFIKVWACAATS